MAFSENSTFGNTSINSNDLRRIMERSDGEIRGIGGCSVRREGRDVIISTPNGFDRKCFVLSSQPPDDSCETCLAAAKAHEVVRRVDGTLGVRCCQTVDLAFLFMNVNDLCGLTTFSACDGTEAEQCLCLSTDGNQCVDTTGCLVFCAYFDETSNQWVSDYRPSQTRNYRAGRGGIKGGTEDNPGCGVAKPVRTVTASDLSQQQSDDCCSFTPITMGPVTGVADGDSQGTMELDFSIPPTTCPNFCVQFNVSTVSGIIHCAATDVIVDGVLIETHYSTDAAEIVCFKSPSTSGFDVKIVTNFVSDAPGDSADLSATVFVERSLCNPSLCASYIEDGVDVEIYNTGHAVEENAVFTATKDVCCRPWVTRAQSGGPLAECECMAVPLRLCDTMTVTFPSGMVQQTPGDPDRYFTQTGNTPTLANMHLWPPWETTATSPCDCSSCSHWNGTHELRWHSTNLGEGCLFAKMHDCYRVAGEVECGPWTNFPCADDFDSTRIYADIKCQALASTCTPTRWALFGTLSIKIKGCDLLTWDFPTTPIPRTGDFCITATEACTGAAGATQPGAASCKSDFSIPGGECDNGLFLIVEEVPPPQVAVGAGLIYCNPAITSPSQGVEGDKTLIIAHDKTNCAWDARIMPTLCFRRCA